MAALGNGTKCAVTLWLAVYIGAGCASPTPAPGVQPAAHATAVEACRAAADRNWLVAVEIDRREGSALALVSGDSIVVCQASRNADGVGFGTTSAGEGRHPLPSPSALSYVTSMAFGSDPPSILVGRLPPLVTTVRVVFADGSEEAAAIGGNVWLAWLRIPGDPIRVEALDTSGTMISRIEDANGLEPTD